MSRLKPISLSNFITPSSDNPENYDTAQNYGPQCPPVTGWRGNPGPVRNSYDDSGFFRGRTDSAAKRKRTETQQEIDAAYDMSRDYLTNNPPPKPSLDAAAVKEALVAATAMASNVKPLLDKPETSEDMKSVVTMMMVLLSVLEAVVEKGIEPLSSAVSGSGKSGNGFRNGSAKNTAPPVSAKPPAPGRNELIEALAKSELESVIFGANLGSKPISNRTILNNNFSADLDRKTKERAEKEKADIGESVRLVEDALSCVENIEFLGGRSKNFVNTRDAKDPRNNAYTTMPVKVSFSDKESRWNFEQTLRDYTSMRAVQSYPTPIRNEMTAFRNALLDRYPGWLIMTRPDRTTLELIAFRKKDGEPKWNRISEVHALPSKIMLPTYVAPNHIVLPPLPAEDPLADGVGGECHSMES
jgi:hypothetical protein